MLKRICALQPLHPIPNNAAIKPGAVRSLHRVIEVFVVLFLLFALHRTLSFGALAEGLTGGPEARFLAFTVGLMSDFWVASLLAIVAGGLLGGLATACRSQRLATGLTCGGALGAGLLVAGHQAYIEFFKFPIIPFHLSYLTDEAFLAANAPSLLSAAGVVTAVAPLLLALTLGMTPWIRRLTPSGATLLICALGLGGVGLHNRNIHYREQWFVPENLQVNLVERLYMHLTSDRHPQALSAAELETLEGVMGQAPRGDSKVTRERLLTVLSAYLHQPDELSPVARVLASEFSQRVDAGTRPILLVSLLESLRPSETGYFGDAGSGRSGLTPSLDRLVERGIIFQKAYATGSVTRGAQEAVLCGYVGSRDSSLMRGAAVTSWDCLTSLVAGEAETFWYHGGEGRFDQQEAFWTGQGVQDVMSMKDFPRDAPRTSWGVGDYTFFQAARHRLVALHARARGRFLLGMTLSLSNHIPWDVPGDAPQNFRLPVQASHPSYKTTAYTDFAFGAFAEGLKEAGIWDNLLMVVASDHGNRVPPLQELYRGLSYPGARLQSHINLVLVGGIVEAALDKVGRRQIRIDQVVSQADIAALIASLVKIKNKRLFSENPFVEKRQLPVMAILEEEVFSPQTSESWKRGDLGQGTTRAGGQETLKTQLYYRAFMQFIGMPRPQS